MAKNFVAFLLLVLACFYGKTARADLIFDVMLDGTGLETTILSSGVELTTHSIVGATTIKVAGNVDKIGPGNNGNWDNGEAWTFSFNQDVTLSSIDFGGFSDGENFVVSSAGLDGLTESIYDSVDGLDYDPAADDFTFSNVLANSDDLYTFEAVTIAAGTQITISYTGASATLQPSAGAFAAVPEPSSVLLLGIAVAGITAKRRRSR